MHRYGNSCQLKKQTILLEVCSTTCLNPSLHSLLALFTRKPSNIVVENLIPVIQLLSIFRLAIQGVANCFTRREKSENQFTTEQTRTSCSSSIRTDSSAFQFRLEFFFAKRKTKSLMFKSFSYMNENEQKNWEIKEKKENKSFL